MMMNDNFIDNEGQSVDLYTIRSWQKDRLVACGISPRVDNQYQQQQRDQPPSPPGGGGGSSMRLPSHYYTQKQLQQQQQYQRQPYQQQLPRFVPRVRSPTSVAYGAAGAPYDEYNIHKKIRSSSSSNYPSISDQIDDGTFDDTVPTMVTTSTATTENRTNHHENNTKSINNNINNHSMMDDDVDDVDDDDDDDDGVDVDEIFSFKSRSSHSGKEESEKDAEQPNDVHDRPTNREFTGATIICALAGLLVGGPLGACAGAASSAYVVSTPTKAGKLVRKGGESVVAVSEKVGDTVMSTPIARKSVEQSEKAISQARIRFENSKVAQQMKAFDEKHQLRQRTLCGCSSIEEDGMVPPKATKSTNSFCLQKCVEDIMDDDDDDDEEDDSDNDDIHDRRQSPPPPPRASVVTI